MAISPSEIMKSLLEQSSDIINLAKGGVVVGPSSEDQSAQYAIEIQYKGTPKASLYVPFMKPRFDLTVVGPELDIVEQLANIIFSEFHDSDDAYRGQKIGTQSDGASYLVRTTWVQAGPLLQHEPEIHSFQRATIVLMATMVTIPI